MAYKEGQWVERLVLDYKGRVTKGKRYLVLPDGRIRDDNYKPMTPAFNESYWSVVDTETEESTMTFSKTKLTIQTKTLTLINGEDVDTMSVDRLINIIKDLAQGAEELRELGLVPNINKEDIEKLKNITQAKIDSEETE